MLKGRALPVLIVAMSLSLTATAAQAQCIRQCEGVLQALFSYQPNQTQDVVRKTSLYKEIAGTRLIRDGRTIGQCNTATRRQRARRAACDLAGRDLEALYANNLAAAKRALCEDTSPELAEVRRAFRVKFDQARARMRAVAHDGTVAYDDVKSLPLSGDWFSCVRAAPPPPPTLRLNELDAIELEHNTDRVGGDYQSTNMDSWSACATACASDAQCRAWTWVKAGIQGPSAKCWLKSTVPPPQANDCCTSGVKGEPRTDRVGGDYQSTNVDNWAACATGCASDAQCRAWTWVKAGIQGPSAKCWLKSTVPEPQASDCCVSGVK